MLAGGQSLIPMLSLRLAVFEHLVDIGRIDELKGIERRNGSLWIGAGTTEAVVGASAEVARRRAPSRESHPPHRPLPDPQSGHNRWIDCPCGPGGRVSGGRAGPGRNHGGCLAPGRRSIPARDFFDGVWSTSMLPDEVARRRVLPRLVRSVRLCRRGIRPSPWGLRHRRSGARHGARGRRPGPALCHRLDRSRSHAGARQSAPKRHSSASASPTSIPMRSVGSLSRISSRYRTISTALPTTADR